MTGLFGSQFLTMHTYSVPASYLTYYFFCIFTCQLFYLNEVSWLSQGNCFMSVAHRLSWFACLCACYSSPLIAETRTQFPLVGVGVKYGSADFSSSHDEEVAAIYASLATPWFWQVGEHRSISTEITFTGGRYDIDGDDFWHVAIGPTFKVRQRDFPVHIKLGIAPTYLFDDETENYDAGGELQCTFLLGAVFVPSEQWHLGLTYQHTSNADTNKNNPGIDVLAIDIAYRF
ncbi:acyloxyacyl hydrolase [Corallincola luteus]|uniref:Acyloxyacyl hydrolase n=2 Tax=Corallincola luteus TaxID=1775177 RepID=A0ABY2AHV5_9GAMM|nr:acyloxyacyl hydrolase [Corallincola luteus]